MRSCRKRSLERVIAEVEPVEDLFDTAGIRTTYGSKIYAHRGDGWRLLGQERGRARRRPLRPRHRHRLLDPPALGLLWDGWAEAELAIAVVPGGALIGAFR